LPANGNGQISLSFLDGFEEGFGDARSNGTDVLERPEPFQDDRYADYRQHNKRIRGDGAFVNDVDEIQTVFLHNRILQQCFEDYLKRKLIQ
jgi:hypothetical protein